MRASRRGNKLPSGFLSGRRKKVTCGLDGEVVEIHMSLIECEAQGRFRRRARDQ